MTSVLALEQPGRWRIAAVAGVLLLAGLPLVPLFYRALQSDVPALDGAFWLSVRLSTAIALAATLLGTIAGLPLGITAALYDFPGRKGLLAVAALPLLLPSFLWAIGWSSLAARLPALALSNSVTGCVLVFATTTSSLVLLVSHAAMQELSRSQVEAARLAGGERALLLRAARHVLPPAIVAAALGGVLTLADPGAAQIFGARTAAFELLTSFAARYDIGLAARQSVALTLVVLSLSIPLAALAGPRLADAVVGRQSIRGVAKVSGGRLVATSFAVVTTIAVGLPITGLLVPLFAEPWLFVSTAADVTRENWQQSHLMLALLGAWGTAIGTATNTLLYAFGAGVFATILGFGLAIACGRSGPLRGAILAVSVMLLAWPPTASALGVAAAATASPPWLDPIVRSRFIVWALLGLRFFPISAVLALRAWGATSPSWVHAAAIHGVPLLTYVRRVGVPALGPSAACSIVLVGLLASAEVGTVLVLHPPGETSLPLAIFTVMANAPESTVAALCLVYVVAASVLLIAALRFASRDAS